MEADPHLRPQSFSRAKVVLLIDDDAVTHAVFTVMLKRLGCSVVSVFSGKEALNRISETAYDLIFIDSELQDAHGADIVKQIRSNPQSAKTPIVATSCDDGYDNVQLMRASGANEFAAKPIDVDKMRDLAGRWLTPAKKPPTDS